MKKLICIILTIMLATGGIMQAKAEESYRFVFTRDYWVGKWNNYFFVDYDYDRSGNHYLTSVTYYQTAEGIGVGKGDITLIKKLSKNTWEYHATCQLKIALAWYIGFDIGKYHREEMIVCSGGYWESYPLDKWYGR